MTRTVQNRSLDWYDRIGILIATSLLLCAVAVVLSSLYATGVVLPIELSVGIYAALLLAGAFQLRNANISILSGTVLLMLMYSGIAFTFAQRLVFPNSRISYWTLNYQTDELFAAASHLSALGLASFLGFWGVAVVRARKRVFRQSQTGASVSASRGSVSAEKCRDRQPLHSAQGAGQSTKFGKSRTYFNRWASGERGGRAAGAQLFWVFCGLSILPLAMSLPNTTIFGASYITAASSSFGATIQLAILKVVAHICLLLAWMQWTNYPTRPRFVAVFTLFSIAIVAAGFLAGNRVEEIGATAAVIILLDRRGFIRVGMLARVVIAIAGIMFLQLVGAVRTELSSLKSGGSVGSLITEGLSIAPTADKLYGSFGGTSGDVAQSTLAVLGMFEDGKTSVDYGKVYFDYLYQTLPKVLDPSRPDSYAAWTRATAGSGGGSFVLNEAIQAGGSIGVFIVMGVFGAFLGSLEVITSGAKAAAFATASYMLIVASTPRVVYYGGLSLYKYFLIAGGLYGAACIILRIVDRPSGFSYRRNPARLPAGVNVRV